MGKKDLKYPVGQLSYPEIIDQSVINKWINEIEAFPNQLRKLTHQLTVTQLNYKYRPDGWTIKQVVHHCADSHTNAWVRFKLALTENAPIIKPYYEDQWAETPDSLDDDISDSVLILTGLHAKWGKILRTLSSDDLDKTYTHPEHGKQFTLKQTIGQYAWHGRHHLGHIKQGLESEGKY